MSFESDGMGSTPPPFPSAPPPEVTDAINTACQAYDELSATGQRLHFAVGANRRFGVELRDLDGKPLITISAGEALRLAGGKSLI